MKKLLLGILFIASPLLATGPLYQSPSVQDQQEHENIYKDLRFPKVSTGTAQNWYIVKGSATAFNIGTSTITQLYNQINAYRRPRLINVSGTEVDIESGTVGGLTAGGSSITVIFPDGAVYNSTGTEASQAVITSTANWGNPLSAGIRRGEKLTGNMWEHFYLVKSSVPGDTTHFVTVISSWAAIPSNYNQLNTNFCGAGGSNCWVYEGAWPYGDGSASVNAFPVGDQSGNMTCLKNSETGVVRNQRGIRLASTAGATSVTWSYAAGNLIGSGQIPANLLIGTLSMSSTGTSFLATDGAGAVTYAEFKPDVNNTMQFPNVSLLKGAKVSSGSSTTNEIDLGCWIDSALGVGSNPQL